MATAISQTVLEAEVSGTTPGVYGEVTYTSSRSGNNMVYNISVSCWLINQSGYSWFNNRWAAKLWVNGTEIWSNQTIKAQTSGVISTGKFTATAEVKVPINSGTVPIKVHFADTGGSSSWSIHTNWGTREGTLAVTAPSAPSKPSSITIPSSAAPDQTVTISWNAASGGSNGVSGYRLAYSKDGGSSWSYENVSGTSKSLNLNSLGFVHGSVLKCAVQSYSTVNSVNYYSEYVYSGTTTTNFVAPSAPTTLTIPSSIAPDQTANISWSASSGGTNGVKGYQFQWSKDGGSNWSSVGSTTGTSLPLDLNANGFVHGSKLVFRVRAYTIGQDNNYYSSWKTSGTTTTSFVAPSVPQNPTLSGISGEPIPTKTYYATFNVPSNTGSNGLGGYTIQWLKNGQNFDSEYRVDTNGGTTKSTTEETIQPGDVLSFKVRAYTVGQGTRYYSDYVTSNSITIVSDKFIYLSQNGGSFTKYKAFISVNGGSFTEIKKEKLKVI